MRITLWNKAIQSENWILGYSYVEIIQKLLGDNEEKKVQFWKRQPWNILIYYPKIDKKNIKNLTVSVLG